MKARRTGWVFLAITVVSVALLGCRTAPQTATAEAPGELAQAQPEAAPPETKVQVKTAPPPRRLVAFDFGTAVSWEGFESVPGSDFVSLSSNVTFGSGEGERKDFPDPILGDYAAADEMTVTVTGLQSGSYMAAVIAQDASAGMVPSKSFKITANGRTAVDFEVTPEWYYSRQGFFYGVQFDDLPGTAFWDRYIEPAAPWREFSFDSKGQLVLTLTNCRLYALVLAPKNDVREEEFSRFVEATQAARKAYFLFNKFKYTIERPRGRMPRARQFLDRGYIIFTRHWGQDVTYTTLPEPSEIKTTLEAAGAPGERVPVTFSVRTSKALSRIRVVATDLSAPGGKIIPASDISVDDVRYILTPGEGGAYHIKPEPVQKHETSSLPARVSKRWWLTVNIPPRAEAGVYTGQVRFTPVGAPGTVLTLRVTVYPFELAEPKTSLGVWYSDPADMGYFTERFGGINVGAARPADYRTTALDKKAEEYRLKMLEADIASISAHGFNGLTVPVPAVRSVSPSGRVTLDFGALDAYASLLKKYGVNTEFPGQGYLLGIARQIVRIGVEGAPIEEYSELHRKACKDAFTQVRDYWKAAGIPMLAYVVDEPREEDINPWNRDMKGTLYYLKIASEVGEFPSTVTTMRDVQNGVSYMPILEAEDVVQPHPSVHNARSVEYAKSSGKPLRFFNGGGFERYDFGFYVWAQKPEGYWQWHYDFREFSFNPFWDSHVGYVVYPSPDGPVPTVRYERAAQGIYDYRYALTLEEYIAKAKASYNAKAADTARDGQTLLDDIRRQTTPWVLDRNWNHVELGNGKLSAWRQQIALEIIRIQRALE